MRSFHSLTAIIALTCLCGTPSAARNYNYSVQLAGKIAPSKFGPELWAASADELIGRTDAHVHSSQTFFYLATLFVNIT